jgi:hypothetical protein
MCRANGMNVANQYLDLGALPYSLNAAVRVTWPTGSEEAGSSEVAGPMLDAACWA